MSASFPASTRDWVATDLDGTLFSRHWAGENAIPGTWREITAQDGSKKLEASSWVRPETHRLLLALAITTTIVPVTARDEASFSRVNVPGLRLRAPAILANGAIVLGLDGAPDQQWVTRVSKVLVPWRQSLERLCKILIQRSSHIALPRLVAGPADLPAYLVAKAPDGWWAGTEGTSLRNEIAEQATAECSLVVMGNELQVLPPGLGKAAALRFIQQHFFNGQAPLLCLGDQLPDLEFMSMGGQLATPAGSPLAELWAS